MASTNSTARLHLDMRPGPEAAGESRHALDRLADSIEANQLEVVRLLVTELVTNSVRHGRGGGESSWIELDVLVEPEGVQVQVLDQGPGFAKPSVPEPHADRPGGWGLCLVDRLSDRWGVAVNGRTRVWFEMGRDRRGHLAPAA
jgi:anti-sigma regulatory factor (Ser/Thr protein kinase)